MAKRSKSSNGSLCWYCRRAGIECEKPVKGWDADYKPIRSVEYHDIPSWFVRSCPEFEQDRMEEPLNYNPHQYKKPQKVKPVKRYDIFGKRLTMREIASQYHVKPNTFRGRVRRGMTNEQAVLGHRYILVGTNIKTGEVREWKNIVEASRDNLGFNPPAINYALKHGSNYKGWTFIKKDI